MVGDGLAVTTMSSLNPSCIELKLGLGFDNKKERQTSQIPNADPLAYPVHSYHVPAISRPPKSGK